MSYYRIERYVRFMSPFAALILTFIGVIMSARKTRGGSGFQIAMGFLLAFVIARPILKLVGHHLAMATLSLGLIATIVCTIALCSSG